MSKYRKGYVQAVKDLALYFGTFGAYLSIFIYFLFSL